MNNRNKALIITSAILLVVALAVFLIGGWMAGWDFEAFLKSQCFIWICVLVGIYVLGVIVIFAMDEINRL